MEVAASTVASSVGCLDSPPPTSTPPGEAVSGERDEMDVEEEYASACEEAGGMEE